MFRRHVKKCGLKDVGSYDLKGYWLPFLRAYRTMCLAPDATFRRVLGGIQELRLGA